MDNVAYVLLLVGISPAPFIIYCLIYYGYWIIQDICFNRPRSTAYITEEQTAKKSISEENLLDSLDDFSSRFDDSVLRLNQNDEENHVAPHVSISIDNMSSPTFHSVNPNSSSSLMQSI